MKRRALGDRNRLHTSVEDETVNADLGVILNADTLDTVLDVSKARQAGNEPAVAEISLLHVGTANVLEEGGFLEDLMNTLDRLGHDRARIHHVRHTKIELNAAQAVETVALLHLEIPVLHDIESMLAIFIFRKKIIYTYIHIHIYIYIYIKTKLRGARELRCELRPVHAARGAGTCNKHVVWGEGGGSDVCA